MYIIDSILKEMLNYNTNDLKRKHHAYQVYSYAHYIAVNQSLSDDLTMITEIAAILHDIGIQNSEKKYNSSSPFYQQIEGPPVTEDILNKYNLDEDIKKRIIYIIANHHTYNKIDDIDFQIVVEADFIVNIIEDNLNVSQIRKIKERIFKTKCGLELINYNFLNN